MQIQNLQLDEKLDLIAKEETLEKQIEVVKKIAQVDITFLPLMQIASWKQNKIAGIPEGMPETYKPDTAIPMGISDTTARQEFRRIKNFLPGGSMEKLAPARRETMWMQMLEGMHWKEANILINIKDQTLQVLYPNLPEVLKAFNL